SAAMRRLLKMPAAGEIIPQGAHRPEFKIAPKDIAHGRRFDDKFSFLDVVAERRLPAINMSFPFDAAILSRMRSPVTSRSNCAKESSTLRVSRPMLVVVLKASIRTIRAARRRPR